MSVKLIKHVRKNGKLVGTLVGYVEDKKLYVGFTSKHPIETNCSKKEGVKQAIKKANDLKNTTVLSEIEIPKLFRKKNKNDLDIFIGRCIKYFSDKQRCKWINDYNLKNKCMQKYELFKEYLSKLDGAFFNWESYMSCPMETYEEVCNMRKDIIDIFVNKKLSV